MIVATARTLLFGISAAKELIEDVEGAFLCGLAIDARLLQQVRFDISSRNVARLIEVDADELALREHTQAALHNCFNTYSE